MVVDEKNILQMVVLSYHLMSARLIFGNASIWSLHE